MAKGFESTKAVNLIAGESLSGDIYEVLAVENDAGVGKVVKATATNQAIVGVLAESVDATTGADGETVPVVLLQGVVWMKAGGNITAGDLLIVDTGAPGRVVSGGANVGALAADVFSPGIALESAVDGDIFPVLAQPMTSATET